MKPNTLLYPKPSDTHFRDLLAQNGDNADDAMAEDVESEEASRAELFRDRERRRSELFNEQQSGVDGEEEGDGSAWSAPLVGISVIEDQAEMKANMATVAEQAGIVLNDPGVGDFAGEDPTTKPERKRKDAPINVDGSGEPVPKKEKTKKHVTFNAPSEQQDVEMDGGEADTNGDSYKLGAFRTEATTGPSQRFKRPDQNGNSDGHQHHHSNGNFHNNKPFRNNNAGNQVPPTQLTDPETDRRITFEFNAMIVKAFMTNPPHPSDTPLTRADQLRHALQILTYCESLKVQAARYGSFPFWMGIYHLELDELDEARSCFDRCIKKDTWLMPDFRLRKMYGFDALPQTRRRHKFQVGILIRYHRNITY